MKVFEIIAEAARDSISTIIDRIKKLWDVLIGLDDSEIIRIMKVMAKFNEDYHEKKMKLLSKITFKNRKTEVTFEYNSDDKQKEE